MDTHGHLIIIQFISTNLVSVYALANEPVLFFYYIRSVGGVTVFLIRLGV